MDRVRAALLFLTEVLTIFLAMEVATLPLRPLIQSAMQNALYAVLPHNFRIDWACTGVDEVLLLSAAIIAATDGWRKRAKRIIVGALLVELYNIIRIAVLSLYPSEVLHEILFRWGGLIVILAVFYLLTCKEYKQLSDN